MLGEGDAPDNRLGDRRVVGKMAGQGGSSIQTERLDRLRPYRIEIGLKVARRLWLPSLQVVGSAGHTQAMRGTGVVVRTNRFQVVEEERFTRNPAASCAPRCTSGARPFRFSLLQPRETLLEPFDLRSQFGGFLVRVGRRQAEPATAAPTAATTTTMRATTTMTATATTAAIATAAPTATTTTTATPAPTISELHGALPHSFQGPRQIALPFDSVDKSPPAQDDIALNWLNLALGKLVNLARQGT